MKKLFILPVLLSLLLLSACGGKTETKDDKDSSGTKETTTDGTTGGTTGGGVNCPPWLDEYDKLARDMKVIADDYFNSGKVDQAKLDKLNADGERFSKEAEVTMAGGWAGYTASCAGEYARVSMDWMAAMQRYQEAVAKHVMKNNK